MNMQQIRKEMASSFRFGWVQSQQRPEHRFVDDPDAYDRHMGIEPGRYEWYEGMDPKDRKPSDQPASSDPIPGSRFVTTSGPISSLGFGGFQSGPHFGAQ
ncbi:hypothetical protein C1H46_024954 [Malus baccata]|uniref:Uncharacterized protein n=1 Tax=Malus baccata TaxID=106549 RepID=A0A540LSV0_MALBA|nr:hypothetical protein C1H46_024954 [Malus baccata]